MDKPDSTAVIQGDQQSREMDITAQAGSRGQAGEVVEPAVELDPQCAHCPPGADPLSISVSSGSGLPLRKQPAYPRFGTPWFTA